jgi:hypothetical protein
MAAENVQTPEPPLGGIRNDEREDTSFRALFHINRVKVTAFAGSRQQPDQGALRQEVLES